LGIDLAEEIGWLLVLENGEGYGKEFVMDALGDFEPVEGAQMGSNVMVLWNFADNPGEAVLDALETSNLVDREVEIEGIAVVEFGMDK